MASYLMHMIEQRAGKRSGFCGVEWEVFGTFTRLREAPLAVRRKDRRQKVELGQLEPEAGRIGAGQRPCNIEADMAGAPLIVKPNIEQMRTQSQLKNDPGLIKPVIQVPRAALLGTQEEALGIMIAKAAVVSSLSASLEQDRLVDRSAGKHPDRRAPRRSRRPGWQRSDWNDGERPQQRSSRCHRTDLDHAPLRSASVANRWFAASDSGSSSQHH